MSSCVSGPSKLEIVLMQLIIRSTLISARHYLDMSSGFLFNISDPIRTDQKYKCEINIYLATSNLR